MLPIESRPMLTRPIWADPAHIGAVCKDTRQLVTLASSVTRLVAGNDPTRWAIGFALPITPGFSVAVSPYPDVASNGFSLDGAGAVRWYTLFEYGTMVTRDWYAHCTAPQDLIVYTLTTIH